MGPSQKINMQSGAERAYECGNAQLHCMTEGVPYSHVLVYMHCLCMGSGACALACVRVPAHASKYIQSECIFMAWMEHCSDMHGRALTRLPMH